MSESKPALKRDVFADIAAQRDQFRKDNLVQPTPPTLPKKNLPAMKAASRSTFAPEKKMTTADQLKAALAKLRQKMSPFMEDHSPKLKSLRMVQSLKHFDWRKETDADRRTLTHPLSGKGKWEKITIPHFGGPLGRAVTYYRTTFTLTSAMTKRDALFIHFAGVDYKAHVFINDSYLGSHEGFFAPFEFDFTAVAKTGKNVLLVKVENDAICMSNDSWGDDGHLYEGDKIYAATGPGYDEPVIGWHHCPPGMGIYQGVRIEARSKLFIDDVFVRPKIDEQRAEVWVDVYSTDILRSDVSLELSVYGRNFKKTVLKDKAFEVRPAGPRVTNYRLAIDLPDARVWEMDTPWLYNVQVKLFDKAGKLLDTFVRQFGMRSFRFDETSTPKGRFIFNNRQIMLRGCNDMGHMQQCVMKGNTRQLIDDILLTKLCNMNFFRFTQRPVQSEIYDACDRLGMLTQTDLPLFAVLRRSQFCETVRQAGEMEKLVRHHPCNIMVTYINEPFPGGWGDRAHRQLVRTELESFFVAANQAVRLMNPDRVIKPVDGDYDPPADGLPDNHCYNCWYNGHGVELGMLHKGYWQYVKPGWNYGCGEFGAEGLDTVKVMRKYYPKSWLPQTRDEEKTWTPTAIPQAQSGKFQHMWFERPDTRDEWVQASCTHQAWGTKLMTEAFRRDSRMITFAIHLGIDAFPSGWMKTIMDVERQPKPAWFVYRDLLSPKIVSLRHDRWCVTEGETIAPELWVCNDVDDAPKNLAVRYQLEVIGKVVWSGSAKATLSPCGATFQGRVPFRAPNVDHRTPVTLQAALIDAKGKTIHSTELTFDVFPKVPSLRIDRPIVVLGDKKSKAAQLAAELGLKATLNGKLTADAIILVTDPAVYAKQKLAVDRAVNDGATLIFIELPTGKHPILDQTLEMLPSGMSPVHFVSRKTGHAMVAGFEPNDFKCWFVPKDDLFRPLCSSTFEADGWSTILLSGNGVWIKPWVPMPVAAEKRVGKGVCRICQVHLVDRVSANPPAKIFAQRLLTAK